MFLKRKKISQSNDEEKMVAFLEAVLSQEEEASQLDLLSDDEIGAYLQSVTPIV
ncbi:MAG: hypothetical protein LBR25_03180 [Erysipelotrichaceae bacterium]|jgi:hypothetical protein|nr:hypothetical protein [Erysipelotrichaceae bacterium]